MTCQLSQQRAGHTLDPKGKRGVLNGAFMSETGKHIHKSGCFFLCQTVHHGLDIRRRIA